MKTILIILLAFVTYNVNAQTNWQDIGEQMVEEQNYGIYTNESKYRLDIFPLKSGDIRLQWVNDFLHLLTSGFKIDTRLVFVKPNSRIDFIEACYRYDQRRKRNEFKAYLVFNKKPLLDKNFTFNFRGKTYSNSDLQNPVHFGKLKINGLTHIEDDYPYDKSDTPYYSRKGYENLEAYTNLIRQAILNTKGDEVTVDLSEFNGFACDIGYGYIRPQVYQEVSYERGRPKEISWIRQLEFQKMYEFFNDKVKIIPSRITPEKKIMLTGVVVGASLGQSKNENLIKTVIENEERLDKLLKGLKPANENEEYKKGWYRTFDFIAPKEPIITKELPIVGGKAVLEEITE